MDPDRPSAHGPHDTQQSGPVEFREVGRDVLTPMGQVESIGAFARGFGARRLKVLLASCGVVVFAIAILIAVQ
jgi:hypothetical protein